MVMGELNSIMLNLIPAYWSQSGIILNHNMSYETVTLEEVYDNQTKECLGLPLTIVEFSQKTALL